MEEDTILICKCHNIEHQVVIRQDCDDESVFIEIRLNKIPLVRRITYALKYVFGIYPNSGAWEEIILKESDSQKIKELADILYSKKVQSRIPKTAPEQWSQG